MKSVLNYLHVHTWSHASLSWTWELCFNQLSTVSLIFIKRLWWYGPLLQTYQQKKKRKSKTLKGLQTDLVASSVKFWLEMDLQARIIAAAFLFQISADILSSLGRVNVQQELVTARVSAEDVCELHRAAASILKCALELTTASVMLVCSGLEFAARLLLLCWIWLFSTYNVVTQS